MKKKILCMLIMLGVLVLTIPIVANAASSGSCGDNATYVLDNNGLLTIKGTGAIADGAFKPTTSFTARYDIKKIVIENGITSIGDEAFKMSYLLTDVEIADTVTSIGSRAFYDCIALKNVKLPKDLKTIGESGFASTAIETIEIPDGVTEIGVTVFMCCTDLWNITFSRNIATIGEWAFADCNNLTDIYYYGTKEEYQNIEIYEYKGSTAGNEAFINASVHYMAKPTTATITKTETATEYSFEVNTAEKYENCYVYAAVYDVNGMLIDIKNVPLKTSGNTNVSVNKNNNGRMIRLFIFDTAMQPIIQDEKYTLN